VQRAHPKHFQRIELYTAEEYKSLHSQYPVVISEIHGWKLTMGAIEERGLKFVDQLIKKVTSYKMSELLAEYCLAVMLGSKSGTILSRLLMMRA
jgi:hypothetical protein